MSDDLFGGAMIGVDAPASAPVVQKQPQAPYTTTTKRPQSVRVSNTTATWPPLTWSANEVEPYPDDFDPTSNDLYEGGQVWVDGARLQDAHWLMLETLPKSIAACAEHPVEHKCLDCNPDWWYTHRCIRCAPHDNLLIDCQHNPRNRSNPRPKTAEEWQAFYRNEEREAKAASRLFVIAEDEETHEAVID